MIAVERGFVERDLEALDLDARVLVVGYGSIGQRHVKNLLALGPGIVVVEPDEGRAKDAEALGLEVYPRITFGDAKMSHAIIATPASEHGPTIGLLGHMRRMLVEKPLFDTAKSMTWRGNPLGQLPMPSAADAKWFVGYNLRMLPSLVAFRDQVRAAPLGRPLWARVECSSYAPDWRAGRPYASTPSAWKAQGGGALRECSHEVDMVRWIFGRPIVRAAVVERTHSLVGDSDDYALAVLSTPYCERVELHLDLVRRDARRRIEVICEQGTLTWELRPIPAHHS